MSTKSDALNKAIKDEIIALFTITASRLDIQPRDTLRDSPVVKVSSGMIALVGGKLLNTGVVNLSVVLWVTKATKWYVGLLSIKMEKGELKIYSGERFLAYYGKENGSRCITDETAWVIHNARDAESLFESYDRVAQIFGCVPIFTK